MSDMRLWYGAVIATQGTITETGAIVRVTASGLCCPNWPKCFPGSFTPVAVAEVPHLHQAIEFGNRLVTFAVAITAGLAVLAVVRARRRTEVQVYAWAMPASTVAQALLGGVTVRTGLLWWTVALHLLVSMAMVWLAVLLYVKVGEPDTDTVADDGPALSARELAERLAARERGEDDFVLLDVREPTERAIVSIPGARCVPLERLIADPHAAAEVGVEPGTPVVVHCLSGGRAAQAQQILREAGYADVTNLTGGVRAWVTEVDPSLPVY